MENQDIMNNLDIDYDTPQDATPEQKEEALEAATDAAEQANVVPNVIRTVRRPVKYFPDPVLEKVSKPVEFGFMDGLTQLIEDLKETLIVGRGLGISAVQIGDPVRVFITRVDPENPTDDLDQEVKVYINPVVTLGKKLKVKAEGCMSFPGVMIRTKRAQTVTVTAFDAMGKPFTEELSGLQAHVVQHETNHLDGITLFHRMNESQKIKCRKSIKILRRYRPYHAEMAARATTPQPDDTEPTEQ